jgi:hypothetical protein
MEFTTGTTGGLFAAIIAVGVAGLTFTPMETTTVLMMVLPSMVVFGLITFALGVKHGGYRAQN